jgi:hypothetical protein
MDKLEPIIKHRFWILLGLVVPLTAFGYYSANGALKMQTTERITKIDGLFGQIPSGNEANPRWAEGMSEINRRYEQSVNTEIVRVWERQQARMTWPAGMHKYLPETYRDPFPNDAGFIYQTEYPELLRQLYAGIEPVVMGPQGRVTGTGKVLFNEDQIPRTTFTNRLSIPSEMIWDAQEDIWYLRLLFDAIRRVNQPAENAAKSAVRAVLKIELWGGSGESKARGTAIGGTVDPGAGETMDIGYDGGMGDTMGMTGGGFGGGGQAVHVAFNPEEEFGTGGRPASTGGQMGGGMGGTTMGMMLGEGLAGTGPEGTTGTAAPAKTLRYVKDNDASPFHERGFYLSVLIDQRKISDFLVELSNSEWPIRIGRCQWGPNSHAGKGTMGTGGNLMMPLAGMGGYGGEDYYGDMAGTSMDMMEMAGGNPFDTEGMMGMEGGIGASPMLKPTGESVSLLQQFDLVQMDLVGYITFFKPPPPDVLAAVQQAAKDAAQANASPAATAPPVTPAAEATSGSAVEAPPPAGSSPAPEPATDPSAAAPTEPAAESAAPGATSNSPDSGGAPPVTEESAGTP